MSLKQPNDDILRAPLGNFIDGPILWSTCKTALFRAISKNVNKTNQ